MQNNQNYSNRPPVNPTVTNNERSDGLPPFTAYRTGGPNPASIYAGFWKRLGAYVIDFIILLIVSFILAIILNTLMPPERAENASSGVGFLITWLYFASMEASEKQGTFGKVAMGIKVTDLQGNRISFGRATGRHFAKIISSFILSSASS